MHIRCSWTRLAARRSSESRKPSICRGISKYLAECLIPKSIWSHFQFCCRYYFGLFSLLTSLFHQIKHVHSTRKLITNKTTLKKTTFSKLNIRQDPSKTSATCPCRNSREWVPIVRVSSLQTARPACRSYDASIGT